jgi:methionyl-tRNA synthetase
MLMSAGVELPRLIWVHGWMLVKGGEKMSKSRGTFFEPLDAVRALGRDGARYVVLREVAFDRDSDVSWDGFMRRYNADLANDYGNLLNRGLSMTTRFLGGVRPAPTTDGPLALAWPSTFARYGELIEACLLHEALAVLWEFVGEANRFVDSRQPWTLNKAAQAGDADAAAQLRGVLGDLLEACRAIAFASAPFLPDAAPAAAAQLGLAYPYTPDGNHGPPLRELLTWGGGPAGGRLGAQAQLFPRLESEDPAVDPTGTAAPAGA